MPIKISELMKEAEKHNKKFHQNKPAAFKKPKEGPEIDEEPKAEKEQKEIIEKNEDQAEIAIPSSTDFFKELRDNFQKCVTEINAIQEEPSPAADKAHQMDLVAKPYGNWADPASGKVVAKTVKGQLVKTDDSAAADTPTEGPENDDAAAEADPTPAKANPIDTLMAKAGGNMVMVQRVLAKRAQQGDENAKKLLVKALEREKAERDQMMLGVQRVQAKNAAELQNRKAKYADKYPSPQI